MGLGENMLKKLVILSMFIALISSQPQRNPFKVFQNGAQRPKCSDNSRPTCVCPDGTAPQKANTCNDGRRPTCAGGVNPVCPDGSAYNAQAFPPCKGGRPRCADGGGVSCQDGTPLPANLARFG